MALATTPSTCSAGPLVAEESSLGRYVTIAASSSTEMKRFSNDEGRTCSKNSFSSSPLDLLSCGPSCDPDDCSSRSSCAKLSLHAVAGILLRQPLSPLREQFLSSSRPIVDESQKPAYKLSAALRLPTVDAGGSQIECSIVPDSDADPQFPTEEASRLHQLLRPSKTLGEHVACEGPSEQS